jgi:phage gpG-like protein
MSDIAQLTRILIEIAKHRLTLQDMRNMANIVMKHRKSHFNTGTDPEGNKWERLRLSTVKRKKKKNSQAPLTPLVDTGNLRDMYVGSVSKEKVVLKYANSRTKDVSGGKSIAELHEFGTDKMPARKHMAIHIAAAKEIRRYFNIRVMDEWKKLMRKIMR